MQCTDGTAVVDCIPECNAARHGLILLLNLDGDDSNLSCNLAHGLYSWMGAASEGGYLGADLASFFSAVVSGVAGVYLLTLTEDADINTDLTIQPGQDVRISGAPGLTEAPSWGSGRIDIQGRATLALKWVKLASTLYATADASVTLKSVAVDVGQGCVVSDGGIQQVRLTQTVVPVYTAPYYVDDGTGDGGRKGQFRNVPIRPDGKPLCKPCCSTSCSNCDLSCVQRQLCTTDDCVVIELPNQPHAFDYMYCGGCNGCTDGMSVHTANLPCEITC
eukprot:COSAG06_NODE_6623_length_2852_cov_4.446785_3_plen_276_part_00